MRIGELSEQSGVKLETIRYYEQVGLLPAPPRTPSGYRQYRPDHLRRLVFLRRSRQLGFSIKEVQDMLNLASQPDGVCKDVTRLAAGHLTSVKTKIAELRRLQWALEKLVRSCPGTVRIIDCGILEALTEGGAGAYEIPVVTREAPTGRSRAALARTSSRGRAPLRPA